MDYDNNKFYVDFLCETEEELEEFDKLCENEDFDEEKWYEDHTFYKEIDISFTEKDFEDFIRSPIVDEIERTYGILDVEGDEESGGFNSYEISLEDAPIVFDKLVEEFKRIIELNKNS